MQRGRGKGQKVFLFGLVLDWLPKRFRVARAAVDNQLIERFRHRQPSFKVPFSVGELEINDSVKERVH